MKKLFALLLVLTTTLALPACAPKDARSVFESASKKTGSLDYLHAEADMKAKIGVGGITLDMPLEADILLDKSNDESPVIDADIQMTVPMIGTSLAFSLYTADGYMYISMFDEKRRTPISESSPDRDSDAAKEIGENLNAMVDEALADAEILEDNEKKRITVSLPTDRVTEEIRKLTALTQNAADSPEAAKTELTAEKLSFTVTVNEKGYFEQVDIDLKIKMDGINMGGASALFGSLSVTLSIEGTVDFVDIGEAFTIEAPADLDSYADAEEPPSLSEVLGGMAM